MFNFLFCYMDAVIILFWSSDPNEPMDTADACLFITINSLSLSLLPSQKPSKVSKKAERHTERCWSLETVQ